MRRHTAYTRRLCNRYRYSNTVRSPSRARWMASASLSLSLAIGETGGAAFFEMHSALGRASQFRLRRFTTVGLVRDATTIFLHLAFAVTCMTSFLSDPQCGLRWKFCFHRPATQARSVAPSFDGLPCVPCAFVWASSR